MTSSKRISNVTKGGTVCAKTMLADRPLTRMRGLLGRSQLPIGEGLLLTPAPSIHTAFMRFAIDAVFLDRDLRVLKTVEGMGPWRAAFQRRARSVLELPAGQVAQMRLRVGDQLRLEDGRLEEAPLEDAQGAVPAHRALSLQSAGSEGPGPVLVEPTSAIAVEPILAHRRTSAADGAMRVMVLSTDRRFREVACLLLTRRGCAVSTGEGPGTLAERIDREGADVVVIDAARSLAGAVRVAAAMEAHSHPVGVVVVRDESQSTLSRLPTVVKWGSFETLFAAVQDAYQGRERYHALRGAGSPQEGGPQ